MSTAIATFEAAEALARLLRPFSPKAIAKRIGASHRTVENWQDGENGPTWKHTVALLNDAEFGPIVLRAAGLDGLAKLHEIESLNRRIEALKAAEQQHRKEADDLHEAYRVARTNRTPTGRDPVGPGDEVSGTGTQGRAED